MGVETEMSIENIRYEEFPDCDSFIIGDKNQAEFKSFGYNIPEVLTYLKSTGKNFEELTVEELEQFRI